MYIYIQTHTHIHIYKLKKLLNFSLYFTAEKAKLGVDDVIEMACKNEMDESDDSNNEFDGYLECEKIEKLLGEGKTDLSL